MFSTAQVLKPGRVVYPYSFFDHPRTVEVEIYLDSNGHVIKTFIYQSGGDPAFDYEATETAIASTYQPAMLLCSPIVGKYLFRVDFER
jgi:TonB family protein